MSERKVDSERKADTAISDRATVGYQYEVESREPVIGTNPTIIYDDVVIGDQLNTGHFEVIRERTEIGDDALVGTNVTIDGTSTIGSNASFQTGAYVPSETTIGAPASHEPLPTSLRRGNAE